MSRATPQDVRDINGSTATDGQIQPFLDTAHIMVNSAQTCSGADEDTLKEAEAYLAAHLMAVTGGGGTSASQGAVSSESFEGHAINYSVSASTGQGVLSSTYGQIANTLLNGCLAAQDGKKAQIGFGGGA